LIAFLLFADNAATGAIFYVELGTLERGDTLIS